MNKFEHIQRLLGLTEKEKGQILSINQANHPGRFYREVWIGLGGTHSAVYATEESGEEYYTSRPRSPKRWKYSGWQKDWMATWNLPSAIWQRKCERNKDKDQP